MKAQVQKWGNSLALRIPRAIAGDCGLSSGSEVELSLEDGRLTITPISSWSLKLESILDQIHPEELHREVETGGPVGNEVW
jgi:antitoxin MazE